VQSCVKIKGLDSGDWLSILMHSKFHEQSMTG
jgi:hypothetical protein